MDATTPRVVQPQDGDPGFLGSIELLERFGLRIGEPL
jgi:hypothetical protein